LHLAPPPLLLLPSSSHPYYYFYYYYYSYYCSYYHSKVLHLYPQDPSILSPCFMALYGLSFANKPLQLRLSSLGALSLVLQALSNHMGSMEVVRSTVEATMALCCDMKDNQDVAAELGACEVLMEVMTR